MLKGLHGIMIPWSRMQGIFNILQACGSKSRTCHNILIEWQYLRLLHMLPKCSREAQRVIIHWHWLRIPDSYDAKIAKIVNFWTFWPVIQLIYHLFKIKKSTFLSTLLRWKKCSDILKIAFSIYGALGKMVSCQILKRWLID